eukprot:TRINITY_DN3038_c0_g2_i1.p1 TRINITY_DN3038_c0_g2~~TRINITY_DN3038_c0_g2_i1.p1  ORF type:complete len:253 (+),score=52.92 TRINITY_DN3038_c0_g2_i1:146-904(+)
MARLAIFLVAAVGAFCAVADAKVFMHSTFDLEIAAKSDLEAKYHDFMLPLMTGMINDKNLTSLRALHPLLNPGRDSRANGILFEFQSMEHWVAFTNTWHLHFLSLSTWWKNWRSTLWTSKHSEGPYQQHETAEGKYYYIVHIDVSLKPSTQSVYDQAVQNLLARTVPALKDAGVLIAAGTSVEAGHSYATHRVSFEFSTWTGVGQLFNDKDFNSFISTGSSNANGFFASWAREVIIAPAPVVLGGADKPVSN